jgi:hypothetical protein
MPLLRLDEKSLTASRVAAYVRACHRHETDGCKHQCDDIRRAIETLRCEPHTEIVLESLPPNLQGTVVGVKHDEQGRNIGLVCDDDGSGHHLLAAAHLLGLTELNVKWTTRRANQATMARFSRRFGPR